MVLLTKLTVLSIIQKKLYLPTCNPSKVYIGYLQTMVPKGLKILETCFCLDL